MEVIIELHDYVWWWCALVFDENKKRLYVSPHGKREYVKQCAEDWCAKKGYKIQ